MMKESIAKAEKQPDYPVYEHIKSGERYRLLPEKPMRYYNQDGTVVYYQLLTRDDERVLVSKRQLEEHFQEVPKDKPYYLSFFDFMRLGPCDGGVDKLFRYWRVANNYEFGKKLSAAALCKSNYFTGDDIRWLLDRLGYTEEVRSSIYRENAYKSSETWVDALNGKYRHLLPDYRQNEYTME